MRKKILLTASAIFLGTLVIVGVGKAYAAVQGQGLVQMIASRFNLNPSDVQSVFDQYRGQQQQVRQQNLSDRLDQAVKDGKITQSQKELLLTKFTELQNNRKTDLQNWKNMTSDRRKAARQSQKQDLQNWAIQNGIDLNVLRPYIGGRGMKMGMMRGWGFK